ncbi:T9SS type A sorting domain-containing protein [Pollutibacter soli]|uniref:T9SS type A sorting domain-containing protein n=1 Tax=Pollutibacter soli TaxID=3034157 RepID=UPI003013D4D5
MKALFISLCLAVLHTCLPAQVNRWTGAVDNRFWDSPGNWSLGKVPEEAHDVVFDNASVALDISEIPGDTVRINSLSFTNSSSVLFVFGADFLLGKESDSTAFYLDRTSYLDFTGKSISFKNPHVKSSIDGFCRLTRRYSSFCRYNARNSITTIRGSISDDVDTYAGDGNYQSFISTKEELRFLEGASYSGFVGLAVPLATWDSGSICSITAINDNIRNLDQDFWDFGLYFHQDMPDDTGRMNSNINVRHNFRVGTPIIFSDTTSLITINTGNLLISGPESAVGVRGPGDLRINVLHDYSGDLVLKAGPGKANLFIGGNYVAGALTVVTVPEDSAMVSVSGNLFADKPIVFSAASNAVGVIKVKGNVYLGSGLLKEEGPGSSRGILEFEGTNPQMLKSFKQQYLDSVDVIVRKGSILQFDSSAHETGGSGKFIVEPGATLGIRHPEGISNAALTGAIHTSGIRSFAKDANYIFNGNTNQKTGDGFKGASVLTAGIDNGNSLTLTNDSIIVLDTLKLVKGGLDGKQKTIFVKRNWTGNTKTSAVTMPAVIFDGDSPGSISGSDSAVFNRLTVNKNAAQVLLLTECHVSDSLVIGSVLKLGNHHLTLADSADILAYHGKNFGSSAMIIADSTGELRRGFSYTKMCSSCLFPVGSEQPPEYSPVTLGFVKLTAGNGSIGVSLRGRKHPQNTNQTSYLKRYWILHQEGLADFLVNASFCYTDADVTGNENDIRLARWDSISLWTVYNNSVKPNDNLLKKDSLTSLSDFTGMAEAHSTPFGFKSVKVSIDGGSIVLVDFEVVNDEAASKYIIERSPGNQNYISLAQIIPSDTTVYQFTDSAPLPGTNSYRVKAVLKNGDAVLSSVSTIDVFQVNGKRNINIYPNPIRSNTVKFTLQNVVPGKYKLVIYGTKGDGVYHKELEVLPGISAQEIILKSSLPAGLYQMVLQSEKNIYVASFIK